MIKRSHHAALHRWGRLALFLIGVCALALLADHVLVGGPCDVATLLFDHNPWVANVVSGVSYLGGVCFAIRARLKMRDHHEVPSRASLGAPVACALMACVLIGLPTFMTMGAASL